MHNRNVRIAVGSSDGVGGWYKTTVTMLVESSALYALSSLLVVAWTNTGMVNAFIPILCQTQVRAFPRPGSSEWMSNMTMNRTGHRFAVHH